MSDTEDTSDPMPTAINADLVEQILRAKRGEPNKYASYWELDEEDIDEATEEQVKGDPSVRILWAAEHGKLDIIKELYEMDNSLLMSKDKDGYTPLHRASYNDHLEVAQYLLDHGADIEARTLDGWTPLHSAANWGNAHIASLLLRHGADVNAQTTGKQTPLHLAASNSESRETIELLLMAPFVDHTLKNVLGETAKDIAERTCKYHYLFEIADDAINQLSSR